MAKWEMVRLGDVCRPRQWPTISTSELIPEGYPVYGANGKIGSYDKYTHTDKTILVTCRGATCGTINICEPYSYVNGNAMALDNLSNNMDLSFLSFYLQARGFNDVISGSAQPQIIRANIEKIFIPLPPLETQQKIADVLDKASALIEKRKAQIEKLDLLIKSQFIEMFGDPVLNPRNWDTINLEKYLIFLTSGSRGWSEYFADKGAMFLTIKNIKNSGLKLDNVQYVQPPLNKEAARTKVEQGDLIISITADLGRTCVIPKKIADFGAHINQHLSLVRLDQSKIDPLFVSYFLESNAGKQQFEAKNQTGVKSGLNFDAIKSLILLAPPLQLQTKFTTFVQSIEAQKSLLQQSLTMLERNYQSLLQKCFRGEIF